MFDAEFLHLFLEEPFLAKVAFGIVRKPDPKFETAYVGYSTKTMELVMGINPAWFEALTFNQRIGLIAHEIYHIVFLHIFERSVSDEKQKIIWNIATDLAINGLLNKVYDLPPGGLIPGIRPKEGSKKLLDFIAKVPAGRSAEAYFEDLKKITDPSDLEGIGSMDSHELWDSVSSEDKERIREKIEQAIQSAATSCQENGRWGSLPSEVKEELTKRFTKKINWEAILQFFLKSTTQSKVVSSVKRMSKKLPLQLPGMVRKRMSKLVVFIDQSGSVSSDSIQTFFGLIENLADVSVIDVYNFDTEIDLASHQQWTKGKKFTWCRTRDGGTHYDCVSSFLLLPNNRHKWTGVIIFTDGFAMPMPSIPHKKLWVFTEGANNTNVAQRGDLYIELDKETVLKRQLLVNTDGETS